VSIWSSPAACPAGSAAGSPELAAAAPPSSDKGRIASILICVGCFVQKLGPVCCKAYLSFLASQSRALENSYKIVENLEKCQTNFVGFRERNPTTFFILTWPDSKYF
jgi:hypothetical protein